MQQYMIVHTVKFLLLIFLYKIKVSSRMFHDKGYEKVQWPWSGAEGQHRAEKIKSDPASSPLPWKEQSLESAVKHILDFSWSELE